MLSGDKHTHTERGKARKREDGLEELEPAKSKSSSSKAAPSKAASSKATSSKAPRRRAAPLRKPASRHNRCAAPLRGRCAPRFRSQFAARERCSRSWQRHLSASVPADATADAVCHFSAVD